MGKQEPDLQTTEKKADQLSTPVPCVFDFTDYRKFLLQWIASKKEQNPIYSFRYVAGKTGFKSAGHLCLILNGKVNLSLKYMDGVTSFIGFNRRQKEYFHTMVMYCQAKDHESKKEWFKKLTAFKEFRCRVIDSDSYEFCEKWYYSAVREIIAIRPFDGDYKRLARTVRPAISTDEAKKAVAVLFKLRMVKRDAKGRFTPAEPLLSTGYQMPTQVVSNYVESTLDLAKIALHDAPREQRNLSWATVSISQNCFEQLQEEIRAFRQKILKMAQKEESPERVYHFQFNAFPMSEQIDENK